MNWAAALINLTVQTSSLTMKDFDILTVLGRGFYGKVMLCQRKDTKEIFAIKTIHKNRLIKSNKVHTIFTERNVLLKAKHPFIVNICFTFQTETKVYFGLEYASGGELFFQLQRRSVLPLRDVRLYIAELCLAVDYLHSLGIIYRDLKPENVLLSADGHVKLTDFGLAKNIDLDQPTTATFCGTSEYLAPEIIARKPYGPKIDWWAIGVLTYELLYGQTPFYSNNKARMFQAIRADKPRFPKTASPATISFIASLLEKDPDQRADFSQLKDHPFFCPLNFDDVIAMKVKPYYIPPADTNLQRAPNFDSEFTAEVPTDSMATPTPLGGNQFEGFSFVAGGDNNHEEEKYELELDDDAANLNPTTM